MSGEPERGTRRPGSEAQPSDPPPPAQASRGAAIHGEPERGTRRPGSEAQPSDPPPPAQASRGAAIHGTRVQAARVESVVVVSDRWDAERSLRVLHDLLGGAGIHVTAERQVEAARAHLTAPGAAPPCVLVDAGAAAEASEARAIDAVADAVRQLCAGQASPAVVLVAADRAPGRLVAAAFRAGAREVIEVGVDDDLAVLSALDRAASEQQGRQVQRQRVGELRTLFEEFLRTLVKAERRSLELEDSLLAPESGPPDADVKDQPPRVLVVDDEAGVVALLEEVLARVGVTTLSCYSGEEAIEALERSERRREPIDLVLIDKNLPGIDGLETVRQLRQRNPSLPVMVMTGFSSKDSALRAANLGVVGFVLKPFDDVRQLAARVQELAGRFATERRERRFLARIKQRHAQFLERYHRIAAELDRLGER